jgi:catechol 2,3-dioxygenase-like lactoylglutathione lyase family enzyme
MLKFVAPLLVVEDMARSRHFYEQILEQKVKLDFGQNVAFHGEFSLHLKPHFQSLLSEGSQVPVMKKAHWGELYFETDDLEWFYQRLSKEQIEFIHAICEQPWGQRVMRFYDPDGHIIEIGETMEAVVQRFYEQGLSIDHIVERSSMPLEFVEHVIQEHSDPTQASGG